MCRTCGLVRDCPCQLVQLALHPHKPRIAEDPLPPHVLQCMPCGVVFQAPKAAWVKHAEFGSGRFHVPAQDRSWKSFSPNICQPELFHTRSTRVQRRQLPVTDVASMTAYLLHDKIVPATIFDLSGAPGLSRDISWTSFIVLLNRVPSLAHVLFLNLPPREKVHFPC